MPSITFNCIHTPEDFISFACDDEKLVFTINYQDDAILRQHEVELNDTIAALSGLPKDKDAMLFQFSGRDQLFYFAINACLIYSTTIDGEEEVCPIYCAGNDPVSELLRALKAWRRAKTVVSSAHQPKFGLDGGVAAHNAG